MSIPFRHPACLRRIGTDSTAGQGHTGRATFKEAVFRAGIGLTRVTENVAAGLLVAIILMNLGQVFFRYVLVAPLSWSEEAMRYSAVWMVLLAGSSALFRGEHMVINLFDAVPSARFQALVRKLVLGCIAAFCVLLMWKGYPAAVLNIKQLSPANQIPMVIPYLAVPFGATLMFIKAFCLLILPAPDVARALHEETLP